jgi:hypothetical protein
VGEKRERRNKNRNVNKGPNQKWREKWSFWQKENACIFVQ